MDLILSLRKPEPVKFVTENEFEEAFSKIASENLEFEKIIVCNTYVNGRYFGSHIGETNDGTLFFLGDHACLISGKKFLLSPDFVK